MNNAIYSPLKAAHHHQMIKQLSAGKIPICPQVQIDPTNRCNHNCPLCWYHIKHDGLNDRFNRNDQLDKKWLLTLLDNLKDLGVKAVEYTGGGEPLLHPDIGEILRYTLKKGFELALVTNGTLYKEEYLDSLLQAKWVRVSMDAATPKTYAKTQGVAENEYYKAIKCIKAISERKSETILGISYVINPMNYKEIYQGAKLAKDLGVQNIRFSAAYTQKREKLFDGIREEIVESCKKAKELEDDEFKVFDLSEDHLINLAEDKQDIHYCGYTHFCGVIGADRGLYSCCTLKYASRGYLGQINEDADFGAVWWGKKRIEFLRNLDPSVYCKAPCWMTRKNRLIQYLVENEPAHINFV